MSSDDAGVNWKNVGNRAGEGANGFLKGNRAWYDIGGRNYKITFPETTTTAVNVIDKTSKAAQIAKADAEVAKAYKYAAKAVKHADKAKTAKAAAGIKAAEEGLKAAKLAPPKGTTVFRLDTPHAGHMYNHININRQISGKVDPHIKISPATLEVNVILIFLLNAHLSK